MSQEKLNLYKEKTRGVFHIVEWNEFWNYIENLREENEMLKDQIKNYYELQLNSEVKI